MTSILLKRDSNAQIEKAMPITIQKLKIDVKAHDHVNKVHQE